MIPANRPTESPPSQIVAQPPAESAAANSAPTPPESANPNQLSAEEQMARFAEELKEQDWGHQPC